MVATHSSPARKRKPLPPKAAPEGSQAPSAELPTPEGKSIFLFSDGTGNSSAKLFKTNVWRMYEAIDFGLDSPGEFAQIGYYDNGVGTSHFRPLALLGGIFGIGLKANVLRLYTFLCRNYQPHDRIYAFGFSRGAFTIRLLVAMVASQGILKPGADAELSYQVRDAYREFRRSFVSSGPVGRALVAVGRAVRDGWLTADRWLRNVIAAATKLPVGRVPYDQSNRLDAEIEFVGVWDTVAAYGGPFAELTRGISDWVYPLNMPEYGLLPQVRKARHALSLDDERDAFWPLLWDEVIEAELIDKGRVTRDRLKQVWFAGVHSDVGGGYPDESLSYVSLLWMMDELGPDVDFLQPFVQRARDLANPYGPTHDSRSGVAAYYRYQPRKITAFEHPPSVSTLSLRPPPTDKERGPHGLLRSVCIHESAIARILSGIDNYAPSALPAKFELVRATGRRHARQILTPSDIATLNAAEPGQQQRYELQENAWDLVWWRRVIYFLTVGVTAALVLVPWLSPLESVENLCSDDRCFARTFVDLALFFLPQSMRDSLDPWASRPVLVIVLGTAILLLITFGRRFERRFRDRVKQVWRQYLDRRLEPFAGPTGLRGARERAGYQWTFYLVKWWVLPSLFGFASLLAVLYASVILLTQVLYAAAEPRSAFCKPSAPAGVLDTVADVPFDTRSSCTDLRVDVSGGQPYRLTLKVPPFTGPSPWKDGDLLADPRRGVTDRPAYITLFAPLKRVTSANWMQVLTEVRATEADGMVRRTVRPVVGLPLDIRKHELDRMEDGTYQTVFCSRWDGRLYVMVNDAAPLLSKRFYANNVGKAVVSVEPALDKRCT
jgi:uncharacterized protein (DUF2235 family)